MPSLISAFVSEAQDITIGQMNGVVTDIQMLATLKRATRMEGAQFAAASGSNSTAVTTQMSGKVAGGSASAVGVVTAPPDNKVVLKHADGANVGKDPLSGTGDVIYGRLTHSGGVWTLKYYTGNDVAYSWTANTNLRWYYLESFNFLDTPWNPNAQVSDSVTATIPDATSTVSGKVLLGAAGGALALNPGATQLIALQSTSIGVDIKMAASHTASPLRVLDNSNAVKFQVTKDGDVSGTKGTFTDALSGTDVTVSAANDKGVLLGTPAVGTRLFSSKTGSLETVDMAGVLTGLSAGTGITVAGSGHSRTITNAGILSVAVASGSALSTNTVSGTATLDVAVATDTIKGVAAFGTGLLVNAGAVSNDGVLTLSAAAPFAALTNAKGNVTLSLANVDPNRVLAGPASGSSVGAPTFRALVAADLPTVPVNKGGTGAGTAKAGFNALSPLTTVGDILVHDGTDSTRLGGNTATARRFLRSAAATAGTATIPVWDSLQAGDLPLATISTAGAVVVGAGLAVASGTISNADKGSDQNIFKTIAVSGQTSVTANSNNATLTIAAGSGVSLTTSNTTKTLTIANAGVLSVAQGTGITVSTLSGEATVTNSDRGSSQSIFKNIANSTGTTQFSAGSNNDSVRFAAGTGMSVAFNNSTKAVTYTNAGVTKLNNRTGDVTLTTADINAAFAVSAPSEFSSIQSIGATATAALGLASLALDTTPRPGGKRWELQADFSQGLSLKNITDGKTVLTVSHSGKVDTPSHVSDGCKYGLSEMLDLTSSALYIPWDTVAYSNGISHSDYHSSVGGPGIASMRSTRYLVSAMLSGVLLGGSGGDWVRIEIVGEIWAKVGGSKVLKETVTLARLHTFAGIACSLNGSAVVLPSGSDVPGGGAYSLVLRISTPSGYTFATNGEDQSNWVQVSEIGR